MNRVSEPQRVADSDLVGMIERIKAMSDQNSAPYRQAAAEMDSAPCRIHAEMQLAPDRDESIRQSVIEGCWVPIRIPCSKCVEDSELETQDVIWRKRGVPGKLLRATYANFDHRTVQHEEASLKMQKRAAKRRGMALLMGPTGVGKGHLAVSALKVIGRGRFITHADLLCGLRSTYGSNGIETTEKFIRRYTTTPGLVIDEFGIRNAGADDSILLWQIIGARYEESLFTALTSNEEPEQVKAILGDRLVDRMGSDCTFVTLPEGSYRTAK